MTTLTHSARETIKNWSAADDNTVVTIVGYVRRHFDGRWGGDACGCPDDRCIGYHHDETDDCGCLPALLDEWIRDQRAAAEAGPVWAAYGASLEREGHPFDQESYDAAWTAAAAWVQAYCGGGVRTFSLDAPVDGRPGISITNIYNDRDWLMWSPEAPDRFRR